MNQRADLPVGAKIVAWLLVIGGGLFAVVGTIGVFDEARTEALMGMLMLAFGVVYLVVGRGMLRGSRTAYLAAVVVLAASVLLAVVRAVAEGDRSLVSQGFVPALAVWALLSSEPRAYYARSTGTPEVPAGPEAG
jgi:lysylphosphatidylglycerol synthetase-like protein (DUF2156 family)